VVGLFWCRPPRPSGFFFFFFFLSGASQIVCAFTSRVKESRLRCAVAARKPLLTEAQRQARLEFALEHAAMTAQDWRAIPVTDEKSFRSCQTRSRKVYRVAGTRFVSRSSFSVWQNTANRETGRHVSVNVKCVTFVCMLYRLGYGLHGKKEFVVVTKILVNFSGTKTKLVSELGILFRQPSFC